GGAVNFPLRAVGLNMVEAPSLIAMSGPPRLVRAVVPPSPQRGEGSGLLSFPPLPRSGGEGSQMETSVRRGAPHGDADAPRSLSADLQVNGGVLVEFVICPGGRPGRLVAARFHPA